MVSVSSAHVAAACPGREGACLPEAAPRRPRAAHLGVGRSCHPGMWLITRTSHAAPGSTRPCGIGALLTTCPQAAGGHRPAPTPKSGCVCLQVTENVSQVGCSVRKAVCPEASGAQPPPVQSAHHPPGWSPGCFGPHHPHQEQSSDARRVPRDQPCRGPWRSAETTARRVPRDQPQTLAVC